jgi:hypothetical protein
MAKFDDSMTRLNAHVGSVSDCFLGFLVHDGVKQRIS